jgi:diguanylate cyclase (GGDEF)-like protein/PAS domain S-box-containing protein
VARDITARKEGEVALRRFRAAMDATSDAIFLTDRTTMRFLDVNDAACRMQGLTRAELMALGPHGVLGQSPEELAAVYDSVIASGDAARPLEMSRTRKDGAQVWVELQRRAQNTGDGWMIITVVRDITERKKLEARLLQQANYDSLTELPNRLLCYDRLNQALIQVKRKSGHAALLFIDLDRFKQVNDTLGHGIGDVLLKQVSERLKLCVRAGDTVGRLGGDEFVIVLPELADARHAALIARKAIDALAEPFLLDGHEASISGSIGIAACPDDGDTVEALIRNADSAMFAAKQAGRNAFRFFGDRPEDGA